MMFVESTMNTEHFKVCPICRSTGAVAPQTIEETRSVRGEDFVVCVEYFQCSHCGNEFEPEEGETGLAQARALYRARHKMVEPKALVAWREALDISQPDLATILGWSPATVSRYENGKLQEAAHDKEMQLAMKSPENLLTLVQAATELSSKTRERLIGMLESELNNARATEKLFQHKVTSAPGEAVNIVKLANLVVLLCEKAEPFVTKLNKLLFYVDFKFYKAHRKTVTGLSYYRLDHGPVPASYSLLYDMLVERGNIEQVEARIGAYDGTLVRPLGSGDRNVFDDEELTIIFEVRSRFSSMTSKEISDFSHEELAWKDTPSKSIISYDFASHLNI